MSGPGKSVPFVHRFNFGKVGDIPVPGYYAGRTVKKVATYRPSTHLWSLRGLSSFYFGQAGDIPPVGPRAESSAR